MFSLFVDFFKICLWTSQTNLIQTSLFVDFFKIFLWKSPTNLIRASLFVDFFLICLWTLQTNLMQTSLFVDFFKICLWKSQTNLILASLFVDFFKICLWKSQTNLTLLYVITCTYKNIMCFFLLKFITLILLVKNLSKNIEFIQYTVISSYWIETNWNIELQIQFLKKLWSGSGFPTRLKSTKT